MSFAVTTLPLKETKEKVFKMTGIIPRTVNSLTQRLKMHAQKGPGRCKKSVIKQATYLVPHPVKGSCPSVASMWQLRSMFLSFPTL